jgi:hypothetical protein
VEKHRRLETLPYAQVQILQLDTNSLEANLGFYAWDGLEILFSQSSAPLKVQGDQLPDSFHFNFSLSSHTDCRIAQGYLETDANPLSNGFSRGGGAEMGIGQRHICRQHKKPRV